MSELLHSSTTIMGTDPAFEDWRKSARSQTSNCVEVGNGPEGVMGIRDSKDPEGPMLAVSRETFIGFIAGVKSGLLTAE